MNTRHDFPGSTRPKRRNYRRFFRKNACFQTRNATWCTNSRHTMRVGYSIIYAKPTFRRFLYSYQPWPSTSTLVVDAYQTLSSTCKMVNLRFTHLRLVNTQNADLFHFSYNFETLQTSGSYKLCIASVGKFLKFPLNCWGFQESHKKWKPSLTIVINHKSCKG